MSTPLISVILPIYKVEEYLDRCVRSIINQTYAHLEIILVDDGSPDNCPRICDDWAKKDPRIRVVHKKNGGLSDARNAGLAVATGELISFIDSDDWVEPAFFEVLYKALTKNDCDIASCEYRKVNEGEALSPTFPEHQCQVLAQTDAMSALIDNKIQQVVWNKLYRRSAVDDIFFDVGKYHEDEFWSYRVIGRCKRFVATDYVGLNYFQRAGSIMGESYSKKRLDAVEAKARRQVYLDEHFPCLSSKARANLLFTCLYHGQLSQKALKGIDRKSALCYLKNIICRNRLPLAQMGNRLFSHKLWLWLSQRSFPLTCFLRNILNIGM